MEEKKDFSFDEFYEKLATEFCKHDVLMNSTVKIIRKVTFQVYQDMAKTLGLANADEVKRKIWNMKKYAHKKMRRCVRLSIVNGGGGQDAWNYAPEWFRKIDKPFKLFHTARKIERMNSLKYYRTGRRVSHFTWELCHSAKHHAARTLASDPNRCERASRALVSEDAVREYADAMEMDVKQFHVVWERFYTQSVYKLMALIEVGDCSESLGLHERISLQDWQAVDVGLFYDTRLKVVTEKTFKSSLTLNPLILLYKLMIAAQEFVEQKKAEKNNLSMPLIGCQNDENGAQDGTQKPGSENENIVKPSCSNATESIVSKVEPLPKEKSEEKKSCKSKTDKCLDDYETAEIWALVHSNYIARGRWASAVLLQRRWYELKQHTRAVLSRLSPTTETSPSPVLLALGKRFPHILTEKLPSWSELIINNRIYQDSALETHKIEHYKINLDVPNDINEQLLFDDLNDWSDDDIEVVNENKETITISDTDDEQTDINTEKITKIDKNISEIKEVDDESIKKLESIDPTTAKIKIIFEEDSDSDVNEFLNGTDNDNELNNVNFNNSNNLKTYSSLNNKEIVEPEKVIEDSKESTLTNDCSKVRFRLNHGNFNDPDYNTKILKNVKDDIEPTDNTYTIKDTITNQIKVEKLIQNINEEIDEKLKYLRKTLSSELSNDSSNDEFALHILSETDENSSDVNIKSEAIIENNDNLDVKNNDDVDIEENDRLVIDDSAFNRSSRSVIVSAISEIKREANIENDENTIINKTMTSTISVSESSQIKNECNIVNNDITNMNNLNISEINACESSEIQNKNIENNKNTIANETSTSMISDSESSSSSKSNVSATTQIKKESDIENNEITDKNESTISENNISEIDEIKRESNTENNENSDINTLSTISRNSDLESPVIKPEIDTQNNDSNESTAVVSGIESESCIKEETSVNNDLNGVIKLNNDDSERSESRLSNDRIGDESFGDRTTDDDISDEDDEVETAVDEKLVKLSHVILKPLEHMYEWKNFSRNGTIRCKRFSVRNFCKPIVITSKELARCRPYLSPKNVSKNGISIQKNREYDQIPKNLKKKRLYLTKFLNLSRTGFSRNFWNERNVKLLERCRPFSVKLNRNARIVKKIELADIDEVRRINRTILTAQVAPITVAANRMLVIDPSSVNAPRNMNIIPEDHSNDSDQEFEDFTNPCNNISNALDTPKQSPFTITIVPRQRLNKIIKNSNSTIAPSSFEKYAVELNKPSAEMNKLNQENTKTPTEIKDLIKNIVKKGSLPKLPRQTVPVDAKSDLEFADKQKELEKDIREISKGLMKRFDMTKKNKVITNRKKKDLIIEPPVIETFEDGLQEWKRQKTQNLIYFNFQPAANKNITIKENKVQKKTKKDKKIKHKSSKNKIDVKNQSGDDAISDVTKLIDKETSIDSNKSENDVQTENFEKDKDLKRKTSDVDSEVSPKQPRLESNIIDITKIATKIDSDNIIDLCDSDSEDTKMNTTATNNIHSGKEDAQNNDAIKPLINIKIVQNTIEINGAAVEPNSDLIKFLSKVAGKIQKENNSSTPAQNSNNPNVYYVVKTVDKNTTNTNTAETTRKTHNLNTKTPNLNTKTPNLNTKTPNSNTNTQANTTVNTNTSSLFYVVKIPDNMSQATSLPENCPPLPVVQASLNRLPQNIQQVPTQSLPSTSQGHMQPIANILESICHSVPENKTQLPVVQAAPNRLPQNIQQIPTQSLPSVRQGCIQPVGNVLENICHSVQENKTQLPVVQNLSYLSQIAHYQQNLNQPIPTQVLGHNIPIGNAFKNLFKRPSPRPKTAVTQLPEQNSNLQVISISTLSPPNQSSNKPKL